MTFRTERTFWTGPLKQQNLGYAGFNSGKRKMLLFLGPAAMLLAQRAAGLKGSILVAQVRHSGCAVEAQLWVYKQLWTEICPSAHLSFVIQRIRPLQRIMTLWWNYPDLPFWWAESCLSAASVLTIKCRRLYVLSHIVELSKLVSAALRCLMPMQIEYFQLS